MQAAESVNILFAIAKMKCDKKTNVAEINQELKFTKENCKLLQLHQCNC